MKIILNLINFVLLIQKLWDDNQALCFIEGFPIVPNVQRGLQYGNVTT